MSAWMVEILPEKLSKLPPPPFPLYMAMGTAMNLQSNSAYSKLLFSQAIIKLHR
jgi:hypothetical protein